MFKIVKKSNTLFLVAFPLIEGGLTVVADVILLDDGFCVIVTLGFVVFVDSQGQGISHFDLLSF